MWNLEPFNHPSYFFIFSFRMSQAQIDHLPISNICCFIMLILHIRDRNFATRGSSFVFRSLSLLDSSISFGICKLRKCNSHTNLHNVKYRRFKTSTVRVDTYCFIFGISIVHFQPSVTFWMKFKFFAKMPEILCLFIKFVLKFP